MAKSKSRQMALSAKRARKQHAQDHPGGASKYARKHNYLVDNGGWGWEYSTPKPWH